MPFQPAHYGLTFSLEQIKFARQRRDEDAVRPIWDFLLAATGADALSQAHLDALRYRINDDAASAGHALEVLGRDMQQGKEVSVGGIREIFAAAHIYEMLCDHPLTSDLQSDWIAWFTQQVNQFNSTSDTLSALEKHWLMALNAAAGVVLEDASYFEKAVEAFKQAIIEDVHPEGYVRSTVGTADGESVARQVLSVCALAITAEIAQQADVDLWHFEDRGVSIATAAQYLIYYYFYPEKWNWETGFDLDYMKALFKQNGAFMELVNYRLQPRGISDLIDDQRPMFDAYGGGLTSLTHFKLGKQKKKRRGLFG